jgi:Tol biopolymer transport system component/DNA-binding winged helix-turn-helix (wHTH) protein
MTEQKGPIFRFAEFEVRSAEFCLTRGGETIPVEPKAFRLLLYLLRNPQRLVTKDELLDAVWQETSVSENSLTRSIAVLRKLLGDDTHEPRFIVTVPTVGYRFVAPVSVSDSTETGGVAPQTPPERASASARRRMPLLFFSAGCAIVLLLAVLFVVIRHHADRHGAAAALVYPAGHSYELLSVHGLMSVPMLSPDAREMAFIWNSENSSSDLYVQLIRADRADEHRLRLTHTDGGFLCCQSWSPDGREIAYGRCDDTGGAVYTVSALGGPSRRVADATCAYSSAGWPLWEADGRSLIIIDTCAPGTAPTLMRLMLATGEKHCMGKPEAGIAGDMGPVMSSDRKTVAFIHLLPSGAGDIYTLTLANGEIRRVTNEGKAIWSLMWTPDSQHIVFRSSRGGLSAVWRVPARGGPIEKETMFPAVGSISTDGRRMVYRSSPAAPYYVPNPTTAKIVRVDLSAQGGKVLSTQDVIALGAFSEGPQLSPDESQIVFESESANSFGFGGEIWKSLADGNDTIQLTSLGSHSGTPRWSPDGRSIAFDTRPGVHSQIYAMDADGRNQRMLIGDNADNVTPSWSHDGKFLYYASDRTGSYQIWKRDLSTGNERQLTHDGGLGPLESYDGTTLYYSTLDHGGLWAVSTTGENERRLLDAPHGGYWGYFAVTEGGVYLFDFTPKPTILYYEAERRKLTPILTMSETPIDQEPGMGASRSGKVLLFAQGDASSSVTMVEYP